MSLERLYHILIRKKSRVKKEFAFKRTHGLGQVFASSRWHLWTEGKRVGRQRPRCDNKVRGGETVGAESEPASVIGVDTGETFILRRYLW